MNKTKLIWNLVDLFTFFFLPPLLLKQVPSTHLLEPPFFNGSCSPIPGWSYRALENEQTFELSGLEKYREMVYKINWINLFQNILLVPWLLTSLCLPHRTGVDFFKLPHNYLLHFVAFTLNQCVAILGACLVYLRIRGLNLHNLHLLCRLSSFLSLFLSFAAYGRSRGLEKTAFSQEVISKTELVYSHAKTCSFYSLNRLSNCT